MNKGIPIDCTVTNLYLEIWRKNTRSQTNLTHSHLFDRGTWKKDAVGNKMHFMKIQSKHRDMNKIHQVKHWLWFDGKRCRLRTVVVHELINNWSIIHYLVSPSGLLPSPCLSSSFAATSWPCPKPHLNIYHSQDDEIRNTRQVGMICDARSHMIQVLSIHVAWIVHNLGAEQPQLVVVSVQYCTRV